MARRSVTMTRARWRLCLFGCTYYLLAVVVLENIIAIVYWSSSGSNRLASDDTIGSQPELGSFRIATDSRNSSPVETPAVQWNGTARHDGNQSTGTLGANNSDAGTKILRPGMTSSSVLQISEAKTPSLEDLEKTYYRVRETRVNPYRYGFTLRPKALCDMDTFMIILVHSHHPYSDRRAAIRRTWGSVTSNGTWPHLRRPLDEKIRLVFMLGTHKDPGLNDLIREEWTKYDDIVQGNFYDSYQNMTLKSLLGLKLVTDHCPSAKYLLKNDDDMFINVPYLVTVLLNRTLSRSIMGPLNVGSKVYRNGKWKLSKADFPFTHYPPYESGAAYLITCDIVRELYETSEFVPSIFIDDVYITGILGRILNVTHTRQEGFAYWTNKAPTACDIVGNRVISGTKMTPKLMQATWDAIVKGPWCASFLVTQKSTVKRP